MSLLQCWSSLGTWCEQPGNKASAAQVIQLYNKLFNQPLPILLRLKLEFRIHWSKHALRLYGLHNTRLINCKLMSSCLSKLCGSQSTLTCTYLH